MMMMLIMVMVLMMMILVVVVVEGEFRDGKSIDSDGDNTESPIADQ